MIGKIKGKLDEISKNVGLIETSGGVYYQITLTSSFIKDHKLAQEVVLFTYLQVREDALVLYGFETKEESDFFTILLTVPGVGPKTAFTVISFAKITELLAAVKNQNVQYFTRIPGLGRKTTMKIMLELSSKLKEQFDLGKLYLSDDDKTVIDALISLGFKSFDAKALLSKIPPTLSVEEKIREGLRLSNLEKKKV